MQPSPFYSSRTLEQNQVAKCFVPNAEVLPLSLRNCSHVPMSYPSHQYGAKPSTMREAFVGGIESVLYVGRQTKSPSLCRYRRHRQTRHSEIKMQTWSDPSVTREYMDYLSGVDQRAETSDCASTIVGHGRIGNFLRSCGKGDDLVLLRGQVIPSDAPGPVYICTRNDDLEGIIKSCPQEKRSDLVFMQNGMLEPLLRRYGLTENTQANIYFAITSIGAEPIDGKTETNPEGLTAVCGKWEGAFAERLNKVNLSCKIQKERDFRRGQLEKLIWISVFNLIGAVHGGITMGDVVKHHEKETTEMILELAQMIRFSLTVGMMPEIEKRLLAYARSVKNFPTALKEFKWRNGFFYDHSQLAKKNGFPDPTPMHTNYLEEGKEMKIISWP